MTACWPGQVTALLFDSDGVLVDSDESVRRAWIRWAEHYGLDPEAVHPEVHGRRAADSVAAMLPAELHTEAIHRINRYELEDVDAVTAVAGARELAASLPSDRWAVVTSGTAALSAARLAAAGISRPAVLVTADDITAGKPAPDGYLAAAVALGRDPGECVVLEDAVSGEAAARAAGVRGVVGVGTRALGTTADVVVRDLTGLVFDPERRELHVPEDRLR
jgi:sugar-phosphatase